MKEPLTEKEKIQMEMLQHVLDHMWDSSVYGISIATEERKNSLRELLDKGYLDHKESMKGNEASIVYNITTAGKAFLAELKARSN